jgi:hypothetical protein
MNASLRAPVDDPHVPRGLHAIYTHESEAPKHRGFGGDPIIDDHDDAASGIDGLLARAR